MEEVLGTYHKSFERLPASLPSSGLAPSKHARMLRSPTGTPPVLPNHISESREGVLTVSLTHLEWHGN